MKIKALILSTIAASLFATPTLAEDKPAKKQTFETVDGKKYRIVLRGDTGYVFNKAVFVALTPDEVQRRKKAAEKTSGCKVSDSQITGTLVLCNLTAPPRLLNRCPPFLSNTPDSRQNIWH